MSITERLRDRSFDCVICFDDLSKHSKSYRQISLILAKIPSRDAFPADIFNIHSALLERCAKINTVYFSGSITGLPIIETINSDITEYISTNVISITDGQFYLNKRLFLDYCRPAIDSGLSVSRIGSNAQCKLVKLYSIGIQTLINTFRLTFSSAFNSYSIIPSTSVISMSIIFYFNYSITFTPLISINYLFFQDHISINSIETTLFILLLLRFDY